MHTSLTASGGMPPKRSASHSRPGARGLSPCRADIADAVQRGLGATGVLAVCHARQLCMTLREGGTYGTETTTSETTGAFATNPQLARQAWTLLVHKEEC